MIQKTNEGVKGRFFPKGHRHRVGSYQSRT
jgi:hypothetical protein